MMVRLTGRIKVQSLKKPTGGGGGGRFMDTYGVNGKRFIDTYKVYTYTEAALSTDC